MLTKKELTEMFPGITWVPVKPSSNYSTYRGDQDGIPRLLVYQEDNGEWVATLDAMYTASYPSLKQSLEVISKYWVASLMSPTGAEA